MSFESSFGKAPVPPQEQRPSTEFTIAAIETQVGHITNTYDEKVRNLKSDDADVREIGREYLVKAVEALAKMNNALVIEHGMLTDETKELYAKVTELQARIKEVLSN